MSREENDMPQEEATTNHPHEPNWKEIALALYESDPCHFDHGGFCQTHGKGYDPDEDDDEPCPHAVIAAWLKSS